MGAFIGADLDPLLARGALSAGSPVTVSGDEKVGGAWGILLDRAGCPARRLSVSETEAGFLAGLAAVVEARARREEPTVG